MRYRLESHPKKKGTCPSCGHKNEFRYYEDENGQPLDRKYGKCERVNHCQYWVKPEGEFIPADLNSLDPPERIYPSPETFPALESVKQAKEGIFQAWLKSLGIDEAHIHKWGVRTYEDKTAFLIAEKNHLLNIKFIKYHADGHRDKGVKCGHLKQPEDNSGEFGRCLYGEHLFDTEKKRIVCIVESEKTAVIATWFYRGKGFDFCATGGNTGLGDNSKIQIQGLHNRKIILLPDADEAGRKGFTKLYNRLSSYGMDVQWLDLRPNDTEGTDLADILIDEGEVPEITWQIKNTLIDVSKFSISTYKREEWANVEIKGIYEPNPTVKPPYQKAVLTLWDFRDNTRYKCAGVGDIFTAFAPPKTGKSTICEVWRATFLGCTDTGETLGYGIHLSAGQKMLHIDTEMSNEDMWDSMAQSYKRAGLDYGRNFNPDLVCYGLKGVSDVNEKLVFILNLLSSGQFGLAILDGIGDLLQDENDLKESKRLMVYLQAMCVQHNICLGTTLHTNEGGTYQKARGHIGSYLKMKASYIGNLNWDNDIVVISTASNGVRKAPKGLATAMKWDKAVGRFRWTKPPDEMQPKGKKYVPQDETKNPDELLKELGIHQLHPELNFEKKEEFMNIPPPF